MQPTRVATLTWALAPVVERHALAAGAAEGQLPAAGRASQRRLRAGGAAEQAVTGGLPLVPAALSPAGREPTAQGTAVK